MPCIHTPGYPRIGARRELKQALEAFWRGDIDEARLREVGRELRRAHWQVQHDAGLELVCAGDFAWYDPTLSLSIALGALPARFGFDAQALTLAQHFELARGNAQQPAMEMTKWFDTNYHHLVAEVGPHTRFDGGVCELWDHVDEALALGHAVKPVLLGPLSWLWLAKVHGNERQTFDRLTLLPRLLPAYQRLLGGLRERGVTWVQIEEPVLGLDLPDAWRAALAPACEALAGCGLQVLLGTGWGSVAEHVGALARLPVQGFHVDLVKAPDQLAAWLAALPADAVLSAGVIDGRNVWRADLRALLARLQPLQAALGDRLWLAPSCSLQHVPVSLAPEARLDAEIRSWLAFADEKLVELSVLGTALSEGEGAVATALHTSDRAMHSRRTSRRVTLPHVRKRLAAITPALAQRSSAFPQRAQVQRERLSLPLLPTTTIGSFPQTTAIRHSRAAFKRGEIGALEYLRRMRDEVEQVVRAQEQLGLDVLVHGEPERNDMVEFFGEQLWGHAFTDNGWVQSYGSRCVKPPIIYGDVFRPEPMTVEMTRYAQSLTDRPMKGMLTGPVTLLQWAFVRDDQPREQTALQLALAIRDEVLDLERAGIRIIQIDEPAFREGLPLHRRDWDAYLDWAVRAFRIAAGGVDDATQIHTHMCYSEFNDILPAIAALDADVITIETSRSAMELLDGFGAYRYPNDIGPGVYDIHSPRVPSVDAMVRLLERACDVIAPERLWVNPDCGLKTRAWPETEAALRHMVEAAEVVRQRLRTRLHAA